MNGRSGSNYSIILQQSVRFRDSIPIIGERRDKERREANCGKTDSVTL